MSDWISVDKSFSRVLQVNNIASLTRQAKRVTFTRTVEVLHHAAGKERTVKLCAGCVLGNVEGHRDGIAVTLYKSGLVALGLYTEGGGAETWSNIPSDALTVEWPD